MSRASLEELNEDIDDCFEDRLINEYNYKRLHSLSKRTMYLFDRYTKALNTIKNKNTWRTR